MATNGGNLDREIMWSSSELPRVTTTTTTTTQLTRPRTSDNKRAYYYVRNKEKKAALQEQVKFLQAHLDALKAKQQLLAGGQLSSQEAHISQQRLANALLREAIRDRQLSFTTIHSALAASTFRCLQTTQKHLPFETCIRLGRHWKQRQDTLLALKDSKIRDSLRFLRERTKFFNPATSYAETSRFVSPSSGDYCVLQVDVIPFAGVASARKVYDALQFYFFNLEISISEILPDELMIREEVDGVHETDHHHHQANQGNGVAQNRFLSTMLDTGIQVEMNAAMFSEFYECEGDKAREFGVMTADFIDDDELFPFSPAERVRQDVTAVLTVKSESRQLINEQGQMEEERVVVLTRVCLLKLRRTGLPISDDQMQQLRESSARSLDVMLTKTREVVQTM